MSTQYTHRPSWLEGGAEAVAMAKEDGLMPVAQHTPGPWVVETVPTACGICHKVGPFPGKRPDDKPRHACLYADYPSKRNPADDELEANAYLIAAAPDLLAACKEARIWLLGRAGTERQVSLLDEAIAKATGSAS